MAQTQFISHGPIAPSPTVVPRRGSGLFSALLVVLIILVGAGTGGMYLISKNYETRVHDSENTLADLQREIEVDSIKGAESLQQRIIRAQKLLDNHIYPSQVFNFLEANTLNSISFISLQYSNGTIKAKAIAPGYLILAEQIRYYRNLRDIVQAVSFAPPKLLNTGEVEFSFDIVLLPAFIHTHASSRLAPLPNPPPPVVEDKKDQTSSVSAPPPPPPAKAPTTGEGSL